MEIVNTFINWAEKNGWEIQRRQNVEVNLPDNVTTRYHKVPDGFLEFLKRVNVCITPDEKSWLICMNEYCGTSDLAFSWDEIEKMSLVEGDDDYNEPIIEFWNKHIPIALSVRNGYAYYALDIGNDFGSVVYSYEPEFEETEKVASSFYEFLDMIMTNNIEF